MPINQNLLIAAPVLQDILMDKTGIPMAAGTITCYHDNSRTTLKNWYYQTGTPGNYTYITLPNPLTLSAAGTITDANGVDTIPFFYPYSETNENTPDPYYITIVNQSQTNQITRANFPFIPSTGSNVTTINTFNNLIVNNCFWRNRLPNTLNVSPYSSITLNSVMALNSLSFYAAIVAPSQHDGFRSPEIQFVKNNLSGSDVLTFTPFPLANSQPINDYIVPEYYINHVCNSPGTGEIVKCYQFPISLHINTLANVPFTFSIQAQNAGGTGTGSNVITINILQDTGTGTTPPTVTQIQQFTLATGWDKYTSTGTFPGTAGLSLGNGADDALYLQIQMPLNVACSINFTKPSLFLTQGIVPNNDFQTYDQVDTIINSPRTGDIRTSINKFYPYGWLPLNNGTIGSNATSVYATSRANADTWPLFNLLWNSFNSFSTGTSSSGANPICPMFNSSSTQVGYGPSISTSAISDWNNGNVISLTQAMGKVILGTVPVSALLSTYNLAITAVGTASSNLQFTVASTSTMFVGQPIYFNSTGTYPGTIVSTGVYYVMNITSTTFQVSISFANALAGTATGGTSTSYTGSLSGILQLAGTFEGEYAHTQLLTELASHNHALSSGNFVSTASSSTAVSTGGVTVFQGQSSTTATTGNSTPFNVTQPGTFYNMYIKL